MTPRADIGVFGGSGFEEFLAGGVEVRLETPYGETSGPITIAEIGRHSVAFLPRHGRGHRLPPHAIPYRANVWAMKQLGVERIFAPCAAGSLDPAVVPGAIVLVDQFVDRTSGRAHTFFDGPGATHVAGADPYCGALRAALLSVGKAQDLDIHPTGTMVIVEGPRFSTRAESNWYRTAGWQVINMTGYPEVILAREQEICYATIALITDYDTGVADDPGAKAVTADQVIAEFAANLQRLRDLLMTTITQLPERTAEDPCAQALRGAIL
ncbi:MAG: S-methyl-5'-thioadenosine phosphorylase [Thermoleophilia bacterium]|nr:MAG: S-methyl-5'-thioadenosine phosphorylase [Thermoleophilia bacterium]